MNQQTIKGEWKQIKGQVKEAFGKLTDDDLLTAEGNADQLVGAIQKRYGYTRDQAQQAWNSFTNRAGIAAQQAGQAIHDAGERLSDASTYDPNRPQHSGDDVQGQGRAQTGNRNERREL